MLGNTDSLSDARVPAAASARMFGRSIAGLSRWNAAKPSIEMRMT